MSHVGSTWVPREAIPVVRVETDFLLGVFFNTFILTTFTHNSILFISSKVRMVVCSDDIVEITCSIDY